MKVNINKLLYQKKYEWVNYSYDANYLEVDLDDDYVDSLKRKTHFSEIRKYQRYNYYRLHVSNLEGRIEKFVGRNISELQHSLKDKTKKYKRNITDLLRDNIDITNKQEELVDVYGEISKNKRYSRKRYYTDKNNIIREYDKVKIKSNKKLYQTKLEFIEDEILTTKRDIASKQDLLLFTYSPFNTDLNDYKFDRAALNRRFKKERAKLRTLNQEYVALYNSIYVRDVRDKPDKAMKVQKIKLVASKLNIKPKRIEVKVKQIIVPTKLIKKSIFTMLTGLN